MMGKMVSVCAMCCGNRLTLSMNQRMAMLSHEGHPGHLPAPPLAPRNEQAMPVAPLHYPGGEFYPGNFVETLEQTIRRIITDHVSGSLVLVSISNLAMIINAYGHDTSEIVVQDLCKAIK